MPEPILTVHKPDSTVQQPDSSVREPDSTVQQPDSSVREPDSSVREPDSSVREPDSYIEREYKETYEDIMGRAIEPPLNWLFFFLKQILEVISSNLAGASTHRCPVLLHVSPVTRF